MNIRERPRIQYIYIFLIFLFLVVTFRVIYLQVFQRHFFQNLAQAQYYRLVPLEGKRGAIVDCKGRNLATSINSYSIFGDPALIQSASRAASILSFHLQLSAEDLRIKLSKKKRFVWIKRKVTWLEKEKIKSLKLKGVGFIREGKRFYPQENLFSATVGIVDIDSKGLEGLELFYDNYLRGKSGFARVLQDSAAREVLIAPQIITPKEGASLVLTVDAQVQYWTEKYLSETIKKFSAEEGSVVIMNAQTGEILALANYPFYNPNKPDASKLDSRRNRAVCDSFEPGSVFKVVTLLAAIESNKFSDKDTIFCEHGKFKIPGSILHDWRPYGTLSFIEVFKKSSNIGVGKIAKALGKPAIYRQIKKLGFGAKTGIDLPGEVQGKVKALNSWSNTSGYIVPIGQEIAVNLIQLARAFSVIANGGYLVKPHIVKSVNSNYFSKIIPIERKRILTPEAVRRAENILIEVVNEGTGANARIEGKKIGGKTGTAQQYDQSIGAYSPTDYRASFVGFVSEPDTPLVIGITVYRPKRSHFGGVVAAPLFKKIAEKTIKYLEGNILTEKLSHFELVNNPT